MSREICEHGHLIEDNGYCSCKLCYPDVRKESEQENERIVREIGERLVMSGLTKNPEAGFELGKAIEEALSAKDLIIQQKEAELVELHKFLSPEAIDIRENMAKRIKSLEAEVERLKAWEAQFEIGPDSVKPIIVQRMKLSEAMQPFIDVWKKENAELQATITAQQKSLEALEAKLKAGEGMAEAAESVINVTKNKMGWETLPLGQREYLDKLVEKITAWRGQVKG